MEAPLSAANRSRPLRYQIRKNLLNFILINKYQPGDQLPSEQELSETLDVSRFSLREALHLLEVERVISTKHGSGRYLVSIPNDYQIDITRLQSVTEMLADYHIEATDKLVQIERTESFGDISISLGIPDGSPILSVKRIRYAKKTPIIYSVDHLPKSMLPGDWTEDDFKGSLFSYLENRCKVYLDYSQTAIKATLLPEDLPSLISTPFIPWILLEQVIYDRAGQPIIFSQDYHRSDHITFHVRRVRR